VSITIPTNVNAKNIKDVLGFESFTQFRLIIQVLSVLNYY
jgi:hypothetical protein